MSRGKSVNSSVGLEAAHRGGYGIYALMDLDY